MFFVNHKKGLFLNWWRAGLGEPLLQIPGGRTNWNLRLYIKCHSHRRYHHHNWWYVSLNSSHFLGWKRGAEQKRKREGNESDRLAFLTYLPTKISLIAPGLQLIYLLSLQDQESACQNCLQMAHLKKKRVWKIQLFCFMSHENTQFSHESWLYIPSPWPGNESPFRPNNIRVAGPQHLQSNPVHGQPAHMTSCAKSPSMNGWQKDRWRRN